MPKAGLMTRLRFYKPFLTLDLLAEVLFQSFAQKARGEAQQKPKERKQRANLSEYIKPLLAVIPYIPTQQAVDK